MTLRKYHPFRLAVMDPDTFPAEEEPEGRVPDLSPELFWRIVRRTPEYLWASYVTMAAGGLGPKEYLACREVHLMPHTTALQVPGSKVGRQGLAVVNFDPTAWVWVTRAVPSPVNYRPLYDPWKKAAAAEGSPELRLYDLRHMYGQWLSESGQPEPRIQVGLRHKTASMTRRYTKQRDKGGTPA
ncbi:MAG: tyrosine-type recombinase/integrase [Gemmatimonadetes bacterium]|nr:tyrosine-type recombinase/integrase [Gemmatimonadota bacterium]